jgi:hypothetical protein
MPAPPEVAAVVTRAASTATLKAAGAGAVLGTVIRTVTGVVLYTGLVWTACTHFKGDMGALQDASTRAAKGAVRRLSNAVDAAKAGGKKW